RLALRIEHAVLQRDEDTELHGHFLAAGRMAPLWRAVAEAASVMENLREKIRPDRGHALRIVGQGRDGRICVGPVHRGAFVPALPYPAAMMNRA
ncbi:MAG: hypothetical protein ABIO86_00585, partial [Sphingomonas sp.]